MSRPPIAPGQAPQTVPTPGAYPLALGFLLPAYGSVSVPPGTNSPNTATQTSYDLNRNVIPGLGFGRNGTQNTDWGNGTGQASVPGLSMPVDIDGSRDGRQPGKYSAAVAASGVEDVESTLEEGELSEGELEDFYEPKESMDMGPDTRYSQAEANRPPASIQRPNGFGGRAQGLAITGMPVNGGQGRERSGSYSPRLSPREVHENLVPTLQKLSERSAPMSSRTVQGLNKAYSVPSLATSEVSQSLVRKESRGETSNASLAPKEMSMQESKQRARQAILSLLPLKVQLQHYLEEGIDENVVRDLFLDLGLEASMPQAAISSVLPPTSSLQEPPRETAAPVGPRQPTTKAPDVMDKTSDAKGSADGAEERKDRIARLLAAKAKAVKPAADQPAADQPGAPVRAGTTPPASSVPVSAPDPKSLTAAHAQAQNTAKSEKDLLLQRKLQALHKAQEAQKSKPDEAQGKPSAANLPTSITAAEEGTGQAAVASQEIMGARDPESEPQPSSKGVPVAGSGIPGLFLSNARAPSLNNPRKRPMASDFDDASRFGPPKRQLTLRNEKPLIIDVSDDSDVEMDLGSPVDAGSNSQPATAPSQRTTSFRERPPLSEQPDPRQFSSPRPQATPSGAPRSNSDLNLLIQARLEKAKELEEVKRRLKEAEARKAAKGRMSSSGQPSTPIPADRDQQISAAHKSLASHEANLRSKLTRLEFIRSEMARLEKEAADDTKERDRLLDHLNSLQGLSANEDIRSVSGPASQSPADHVGSRPVSAPPSGAKTPSIVSSSANSLPVEEPPVEMKGADAAPSPEPPPSEITESSTKSAPDLPAPKTDAMDVSPSQDSNATAKNAEESDSHSSSNVQMEDVSENTAPEPDLEVSPPLPGVPHDEVIPLTSEAPPSTEVDTQAGGTDFQEANASVPAPQQISSGGKDTIDDVDANSGEVEDASNMTRDATLNPPSILDYSSPLRQFLAYRFHPDFLKTVSGGLRSMTYSNRVNPNVALCPQELCEGTCQNRELCQFQHFDSIKVADDQILLQLGNASFLNAEQRAKFIDGLRSLLYDFRSRKVKDFDLITQAIIEYRAKFMGDPSRILHLKDVEL